jgi:putative peptide zinc metalloprotease protein
MTLDLPSRTRRLLGAIAVTLALCVGFVGASASPASADEDRSGKDNAAIAINDKDGSALFKFALNITRVTGSVADPQNVAIAYATCTQCKTVAIAIQIVLIEGSPNVFTPTNVAIAVNEGCSYCDTLASAYQFVFQSSGRMELTTEGRKQLRDVLKAIRELENSGLPAPELQAKVDLYAHQIFDIFKTHLVLVKEDGQQGDHVDTNDVKFAPTDSTTSTTQGGGATTTTTGASRTTTTTAPRSTTTSSTSTTTPASTTTTTTATP